MTQEKGAHLQDCVVHLHPDDPVAIAKCEILPGMELALRGGRITVREAVPSGHKVAIRNLQPGEESRSR